MKKPILLLLGMAAALCAVLLFNRSGPESAPGPGPVEESGPSLAGVESAIEASLRNPDPTPEELQREIALHEDALFYANELVIPEAAAPPRPAAGFLQDAAPAPASGGEAVAALEARFLEVMELTDEHERRGELRDIAASLAGNDAVSASRLMQAILGTRDRFTDGDGYAFATTFVDDHARTDPAGAAAWCADLPEQLIFPAHQLVTRHWAEQDPEALDSWMQTIPDSGQRANIIRMMSQTLTNSGNHGFALSWSKALAQQPADGPRLSDVVVTHWGRAEFEAAAQWAISLPDPDDRSRGLVSLAGVRADSDAPGAANWALESLQGQERLAAIQESLIHWTQENPAAAAAWTDQLNDPDLTDASFDMIAMAWLRKDPQMAESWIEKAPVNQQRKDYLFAVARQ